MSPQAAKKAAKGMGRKPVSIGAYGTQDAIWRAIRELGTFTMSELICHVARDLTVNDATVISYVKRLVKGDYLSVEKTPKHRGVCRLGTFSLVKNTGVETPRITKQGKPVEQGRGTEQMWRTMKILREFDFFELALAASTPRCQVAEATAKKYCRILASAGYLVTVTKGVGRRRARYRLIASKNTGPRPPQVQRIHQLFDPNLDKVVWRQGGEQ